MDKLTELFNQIIDLVDIYTQAGDGDLKFKLKLSIAKKLDEFKELLLDN